tara:strand:+ start:9764 stop:10720 length:957 start_codon:yes stop_codon:yes gene_type:complete
MNVNNIFQQEFSIQDGVFIISDESNIENQSQTNDVFSEKWIKYSQEELSEQEALFEFQKKWYLDLYSFKDEDELAAYLSNQEVILDAGCGLGYKAKWFADLSPESSVIGMDYSDAVFVAAKRYKDTKNLFFVKGDIADTKFHNDSLSYISCDQVIHHTENPLNTLKELARIIKKGHEIAVYVYAKKALPRELLDDYFRLATKNISSEDMWEMSEQLTELGKVLTDLNIEIEVPDIPLLDIKGGRMDLQRFIYWNFVKCFWNEDLGKETSISTNYDWYAPSNADRYSIEEFKEMLSLANLEVSVMHTEEACHSGRFLKF